MLPQYAFDVVNYRVARFLRVSKSISLNVSCATAGPGGIEGVVRQFVCDFHAVFAGNLKAGQGS